MANFNVNKLKGNLQQMFNKSLNDLIRGIRNNKDNEVNCCVWFVITTLPQGRYIAQCMEEIKVELRNDNSTVKANAVAKLCYVRSWPLSLRVLLFALATNVRLRRQLGGVQCRRSDGVDEVYREAHRLLVRITVFSRERELNDNINNNNTVGAHRRLDAYDEPHTERSDKQWVV